MKKLLVLSAVIIILGYALFAYRWILERGIGLRYCHPDRTENHCHWFYEDWHLHLIPDSHSEEVWIRHTCEKGIYYTFPQGVADGGLIYYDAAGNKLATCPSGGVPTGICAEVVKRAGQCSDDQR